MRASSPTGVCYNAEVAVSRLAAGLAVGRRGGIYPSRGCSRCGGGCGRGMPLPYMPSGNDRPHGKAGCPPGGKPIVGTDSISARGVRGAAGLPGTMRASSPTGVCYNTKVVVSRLAAGPPWVVGGGGYPSRGRLRRSGVRRDEGIPPYGRFIGSAYTGKAACFRRGIRGFPVRRGPAAVRRGGIYPSRGCLRCGRGCGTMQASSPTGVCYNTEVVVSRLAASLPWVVGGDLSLPRAFAAQRGAAG